MKMWFTAQELADASAQCLFRDLPATKMGILKLADREGWDRHHALVRRRPGREGGGGFEYHIEQLPLSIRLGYIARQFAFDPAATERPVAEADGLSERGRELRDAKITIVEMADAFRRQTSLAAHAADACFADLFNHGSLPAPEWLRSAIKSLSRRTIANYREAVRQDASRLGRDPAQSRKGTGLLDTANGGEVRNFILALVAMQPHLAAREVRKQCRAEFGDQVADRQGELKPMPPERTFQHFLKGLKASNDVMLTKLTDPDRFRSHYALSGVGALRHVTEPNQLWQIDASPVDALCVDGRHSIYMCLDIATRRIIITVSKTPRASAVGLLIRKAILAWGTPGEIKTDNGSDFVARETERLFRFLQIEAIASDAYSPEQKGHVERVIKTFQHQVCPLLPGYVGHNVADRKAIEGRKSFAKRLGETEAETFGVSLTAAELQRHIDDWVELTYSHAAHGGLKGKTPAEVAAAARTAARMVDERALDVLLMPVAGSNGVRTMTKRGIRIDGHHYMTGDILPGTAVFVRRDPIDAGRIYAFSQDGAQFVGLAVCAELAGVKPESLLRAARERQAEIMADALAPVRSTMRRLAKGPALIERALEVDRRDAVARAAEAANVIRLPRREETHTTPQIDAAIAAFEQPSRSVRSAPLDAAAQERHRQLVAEFEAPDADTNVVRLRKEETPEQRFSRLIEVECRRDRGEPVTEDEAYELGSYQLSSEYKSRKIVWEDFGEQAPVLRT